MTQHRNNRPIKGTPEEFERFIEFDPNSGCWLWSGALANGYGIKRWPIEGAKKEVGAHQIAWLLYRGEWPQQFVLHQCDTPCCVNPAHLYLGDARANAADRMKRGRHRQWVLSDEAATEIRRSTATAPELALRFGVAEQTIRSVRLYRTHRRPRHNQPLGLHPDTKLDEEKVRVIRLSTETNVTLAKRYGVSATVVGQIKRGIKWRWVK